MIGTSNYGSSQLVDLPAVRNNLDDLAAVLTDPALGGISPGRCVVIPDPADARTVYRTLRRYATAAEDTILVYFAGHGQTGPRNELYLGLADTDPDELRVSALAFDLVREVLADCPAANRVVILDCCFSGRAIQDMGGDAETILGQVGIEGTYVLASAPVNAVALAPIGATHTAFTGELLNLLRTGVPDGPEFLTYGEIYRKLLHATTTRGLPTPRQRGTGTVDLLALCRNSAVATVEAVIRPATSPEQPVVPHAPAYPPRPRVPPVRPRPTSLADTEPPQGEPRLLRSAGRIALLAMLIYGLSAICDPILMIADGFSLVTSRAQMTTSPGPTVGDFAGPVFNILVGAVVWRRTRLPNPRAWTGAGVLLGYGLVNAVGIPYAVTENVYASHRFSFEWMPQVIISGRILLCIAVVAAAVAVTRMRPQPKATRPVRLRLAAGIATLALAGAGIDMVARMGSGNASGSLLFMWVSTGVLAVLLPVAGLFVRPVRLAAGLFGGWLVSALSIGIYFVSTWGLNPDARANYVLFGVINLGLFIASWMYLRRASTVDPQSAAAAEVGAR
ncbi:caspase domain-containing protein [Streptomyces sp. NPDC019890]|uniref:caspase family protein n=1 Tax=Streptomyces sp. NPDC019890 TaxID=3365064 RepID=UPI00384F4919